MRSKLSAASKAFTYSQFASTESPRSFRLIVILMDTFRAANVYKQHHIVILLTMCVFLKGRLTKGLFLFNLLQNIHTALNFLYRKTDYCIYFVVLISVSSLRIYVSIDHIITCSFYINNPKTNILCFLFYFILFYVNCGSYFLFIY